MQRLSGIFILDKPVGPSSRATLDMVQRRLRLGALGHAGTLDPLASGLLLALVGKATRLQSIFMDARKRYVAVVRFGETSPTLDGEMPAETTGVPVPSLNGPDLDAILNRFRGLIQQVPPAHSAVRIEGKRAWELARAGVAQEPEARQVEVFRLERVHVDGTDWTLDVTCGAGTYIRSLARDLGAALGCGGRLVSLRRTEASTFKIEEAVEPIHATSDHFLPLERALVAFPRYDLSAIEAFRVRHGLRIKGTLTPSDLPSFGWWEGKPWCRFVQRTPDEIRSDLFVGNDDNMPKLGQAEIRSAQDQFTES